MSNPNSTPATLKEFHAFFPLWPDDSLSSKTVIIRSGSLWDLREIGTFQVLRTKPRKENPEWLSDFIEEATVRVEENKYMQSILQLFSQNWGAMTHEELTRSAGPLASFVTLLSQVLETPVDPEPHRELRSQIDFQGSPDPPSTSFSSSSALSSPSPERPSKKARIVSPSYCASTQSDQSTHDQRAKSEATTNACIYELLRCITEISRKETYPSFRLEWTITQDTIIVQTNSHTYSTANDGGFVHKDYRMGRWQRASDDLYCAIEAKSWHNIAEKPRNVKAQEAAHMIAMFAQRMHPDDHLHSVVPLVSGAQNMFSLVLGNFPIEYRQYLDNGSQSGESAFVQVEECGMFKLQDPDDLERVFTIIVALNLKLQSLGPLASV